jgi:predicted O-methyltransferase YrrM
VSVVSRLSSRYRQARKLAPELRRPFFLAPIHRRSERLLRRRLRLVTGARGAGRFSLEAHGVGQQLATTDSNYYALAPDFAPGSVHPSEGAFLYSLVRTLRPAAVVETGTASGFSTTYLLAALDRNDAGRLVSIDLPFEAGTAGELKAIVAGTSIDLYDASPVPAGKQPGWAVPDELRARWQLRLGDARDLLPATLEELGEIELFFHDSLHTREHMLFEFETAWPHLAAGGVLVADDVFQRKHDALPAFARQVGRKFSTFGNLGLIRK